MSYISQFEQVGRDTDLVFKRTENESVNLSDAGKVLQTKGYLPIRLEGNDLHYASYGQMTLKDFLKTTLKKSQILNLICTTGNALLAAEQNGLSVANTVLEPSYVYVSENGTVSLVYLPIEAKLKSPSFALFVKYILMNTAADPSEDRNYISDLINKLNDGGVFSLQEYIQYAESLASVKKTEDIAEAAESKPVSEKKKAFLISVSDGKQTEIEGPRFSVGYDRGFVNLFIDNPAVSHSHAEIIEKNDGWYLIDTGSSNHTYINSIRLVPYTETKLSDGDKIRFANVSFNFRIE